MSTVGIHHARFADLDVTTLYALLRLRVDVFVVEQECAYPELDGRDVEPSTWHLWCTVDDAPVAYLRVLDNAADSEDDVRIGRVVTTPTHRGRGLAGRLMERALDLIDGRPAQLNAQSVVVAFYERYDFAVSGPEFLDDGIAHMPMWRSPRHVTPTAPTAPAPGVTADPTADAEA